MELRAHGVSVPEGVGGGDSGTPLRVPGLRKQTCSSLEISSNSSWNCSRELDKQVIETGQTGTLQRVPQLMHSLEAVRIEEVEEVKELFEVVLQWCPGQQQLVLDLVR